MCCLIKVNKSNQSLVFMNTHHLSDKKMLSKEARHSFKTATWTLTSTLIKATKTQSPVISQMRFKHSMASSITCQCRLIAAATSSNNSISSSHPNWGPILSLTYQIISREMRTYREAELTINHFIIMINLCLSPSIMIYKAFRDNGTMIKSSLV